MIAIVDDDASFREATKGFVRSLGYRASTFESAEELLSCPDLNETACVISDVHMPGISGFALQERLSELMPETAVILMTALPEEAGKDRALAAGAAGFFAKPFDEDSVIVCLEGALQGGTPAPSDH